MSLPGRTSGKCESFETLGGIPLHRGSVMLTRTACSIRLTPISTLPPIGEYLAAFEE